MTNLRTPHARNRLAPRPKPYKFQIVRGLTLGYYRATNGTGTWSAILAAGAGKQRQVPIGDADAADGSEVMSFEDACDKARALRGEAKGETFTDAPATIRKALEGFEASHRLKGKSLTNVASIRYHLPENLLDVPLTQITAARLRAWHNTIQRKPGTVNRLVKLVRACFTDAAKVDRRVAANSHAWKSGLEIIENADGTRDLVLEDAQINAWVNAAYEITKSFGINVQLHAETGRRTDQIARCKVSYLQNDALVIPPDRKGNGRRLPFRMPLTASLAAALRSEVTRRGAGPDAPLHVQPNGKPWNSQANRHLVRRAARVAGIPADKAMAYAFRHSSVVRQLRRGMSIKDVADFHATSVAQIERQYAAYMPTDKKFREYLLETRPLLKVVA